VEYREANTIGSGAGYVNGALILERGYHSRRDQRNGINVDSFNVD